MDSTTKIEIDALDDLLETERAALLSGDLEGLTRLAASKEQLIQSLNATEQTDLEALSLLDSKVKRNQQLLDSALEGIRSVARRMGALRRIRASLDTYDATGQKQSIEVDATRSVERHA